MNGPKLTIEQQIEDMKRKGITFSVVSEDEAKKFLRDNTYYFKLKSYERNYTRYMSAERKGQYIALDFAYLKELSTLDMYLRRLILSMALDVEHALKVQLMYDLSVNEQEDGYAIVQKYQEDDFTRVKMLHDKIGKSAGSDLIRHHMEKDDRYALWEIVEVLSFGDFIDLYQMYYSWYPKKNEFSSYLWSMKFLRNAAAHNNCLLNSLRAPYDVKIQKNRQILNIVSQIKSVSSKSRETWMKNPVVHDFIVLTYVYLNVVKSDGIRSHGIEYMNWLFKERMLENADYFKKNNSIFECYRFVWRVISWMCNKYR